MECNKEEAVRAKQIAEQRMESRDFLGARKTAVKAQKLYPHLENISQLIMVCDVHCSAESKVYGTEMDWYGILKIEPTADEALIKKQFRKFALILHPDKNKFAGAADAFKLIGEAQRVLLDQEKRKLHDKKCKYAVVNGAAKEANRPSNVRKAPGPGNRFMNSNKQFQQAPQTAQTGSYNNRPTFWTVCPFCSVRYQYYRDLLHKVLSCQSCGKSFTGYEVTAQGAPLQNNWSRPAFAQGAPPENNWSRPAFAQGAPPENNWSQPAFAQGAPTEQAFSKQKGARNQGPSRVGPQVNVENFATKVELGVNSGSGNTWYSKVPQGPKLNGQSGDATTNNNLKRKAAKSERRGNIKGKKRRQLSESSESCNSETSTESEEEVSIEGGGFYSEQLPRRSSRSKRNVSYRENIIDDNETLEPSGGNTCGSSLPTKEAVEDSSSKQVPSSTKTSTRHDAHVEQDEKVAKVKEHTVHAGSSHEGSEIEKEETTEDAETEPEIYEYPDPDFSDFDKDRQEKCFAVGQIWAIYDTQDAMPRFYAQIRKVLCPSFKLRITWLEPDPDDKDEINWVEGVLPVSCGNFKCGITENTEDHPMFSHMVSWEKGRGRNTFRIYPRKGETWALFKNWDINLSSDPDGKNTYTYEFVEILSDYADGIAISVAYLVKVKGFACLFCRTKLEEVELFEVAPKELYRFSHRIPSFKLTGEEREDVPAGSFELDPACLPTDIQEIHGPANGETITKKMHPVGSGSSYATDPVEPTPKFQVGLSKHQAEPKNHSYSHGKITTEEEDQKLQSDSNFKTVDRTDGSCAAPASPEEAYEIPEPEFYSFVADKSIEKFEVGQIWALYCDEDGLPKSYGRINKIDPLSEQKLHIMSLVVDSTTGGMVQWIDKKMPITCGRFKVRKMKKQMQYTDTSSFSHQVIVRVEKTEKNEEYLIFPRKGEVWALYKNWNIGMKCSDLENCKYDMVEVVEETDSGIAVLLLEPVDGFKSVFRPQMEGTSTVTIKIPSTELLRFSHQIPAFRLTEERGGKLRGYLELDPAALPLFCLS